MIITLVNIVCQRNVYFFYLSMKYLVWGFAKLICKLTHYPTVGSHLGLFALLFPMIA